MNTPWQFPLFVGAFGGFAIAIWSSLTIYELNSNHIEEALCGSSSRSPELQKYDRTSKISFIVGAVCAFGIGISAAAIQTDCIGERAMAEKSSGGRERQVLVRESVDGIGKLSPSELTKSLDGIGALSPQNILQPQQPTPQSNQDQIGSQRVHIEERIFSIQEGIPPSPTGVAGGSNQSLELVTEMENRSIHQPFCCADVNRPYIRHRFLVFCVNFIDGQIEIVCSEVAMHTLVALDA